MNGNGAGKRFEKKFREAMEPHGFVLRIPNSVQPRGGRLIGSETEADFLVATGEDSYLVECKASNRPRLDFYNVKEHQEESLAGFDAMGPRCHGFLAVEFYDRDGYRMPHRMFLLPVGEWLAYKEESGRKSMPVSEFEARAVEVPYERGAYRFDGRWHA